MGFKADKVTMGGFLSEYFGSPLAIVITPMLHIHTSGPGAIGPFGATVPRVSVSPAPRALKRKIKTSVSQSECYSFLSVLILIISQVKNGRFCL
jgi:hypothetical protein